MGIFPIGKDPFIQECSPEFTVTFWWDEYEFPEDPLPPLQEYFPQNLDGRKCIFFLQSPITIIVFAVTTASITKVMFRLIHQFKCFPEGVPNVFLIVHLHHRSSLINWFQVDLIGQEDKFNFIFETIFDQNASFQRFKVLWDDLQR